MSRDSGSPEEDVRDGAAAVASAAASVAESSSSSNAVSDNVSASVVDPNAPPPPLVDDKNPTVVTGPERLRLVKISGFGKNDCALGALLDSIYPRYLDDSDIFDLINKPGPFDAVFRAVEAQPKELSKLYPNPAPAPSEGSHVEELVGKVHLPDLSTQERQARLGAALRTVLGDLFINGPKDDDVALKPMLNNYKKRLIKDFERFLEQADTSSFVFNEYFLGITDNKHILDLQAKFEEIKQKEATPDQKKDEIKRWWQAEGRAQYGKSIKSRSQSGPEYRPPALTEYHIALVAAKLRVRFSYRSSQTDETIDVENGVDETAPKMTLYHDHLSGHWLVCLPQDVFDAFNNAQDDDAKRLEIDHATEKRDQEQKAMREQQKLQQEQQQQAQRLQELQQEQYAASDPSRTLSVSMSSPEFITRIAKSQLSDYPESLSVRSYFSQEGLAAFSAESTSLKTITGFVLDLSPPANGKTEALVITARYDASAAVGRTLSDVEIRAEKLANIAAAYVVAFKENGMPLDRLQIDLKKIGKDWTEGEAIAAFKKAGFKRILIDGKEVFEDFKKETSSDNSSISASAPPEPKPKTLVESARHHMPHALALVGGVAGTALLATNDQWGAAMALMGTVALAETAYQFGLPERPKNQLMIAGRYSKNQLVTAEGRQKFVKYATGSLVSGLTLQRLFTEDFWVASSFFGAAMTSGVSIRMFGGMLLSQLDAVDSTSKLARLKPYKDELQTYLTVGPMLMACVANINLGIVNAALSSLDAVGEASSAVLITLLLGGVGTAAYNRDKITGLLKKLGKQFPMHVCDKAMIGLWMLGVMFSLGLSNGFDDISSFVTRGLIPIGSMLAWKSNLISSKAAVTTSVSAPILVNYVALPALNSLLSTFYGMYSYWAESSGSENSASSDNFSVCDVSGPDADGEVDVHCYGRAPAADAQNTLDTLSQVGIFGDGASSVLPIAGKPGYIDWMCQSILYVGQSFSDNALNTLMDPKVLMTVAPMLLAAATNATMAAAGVTLEDTDVCPANSDFMPLLGPS